MNLLKSIFVSAYMMAAMAIIAVAGRMLYLGESPVAWGGVMLTAAPLMMLISRLMLLRDTPRTSAHLPWLAWIGAFGVGLSAWAAYSGSADYAAAAIALGSWIGLQLFSRWYSEFGRTPSTAIGVGQILPAFTVRDGMGRNLDSTHWRGKPAIFIFFRGNWCPLCMAQIKELVAHYREIEALGVRVALISPQPHSNTISLAKQHGVSFDFLTDEGNRAARMLGIDIDHGIPMGMQMMGYDSETVLPTVIITDADGRIVWNHQTDNYRIRPEPSTYLSVLRASGLADA